MSDENTQRIPVLLSERDLSCIRWAGMVTAGIEDDFPEAVGKREGEATSDVLAAIASRAEAAVAAEAATRRKAADEYAGKLADELGVPWQPEAPLEEASP